VSSQPSTKGKRTSKEIPNNLVIEGSTRGLFIANDIFEPRYVWDPTVHKFYGERLVYFIIRFDRPPDSPLRDLESSLGRAGIRSYCVYKVYGYYDAILRVWAAQEVVDDFTEAYRGLHPHDEVHDFWVFRSYFDDWSTHEPSVDDRYIGRFEDDIELVVRGTVDKPALQPAIERLREGHLLHYMDPSKFFNPSDGPFIKFYCALGRPAPAALQGDVELMRDMASQLDGIKLKSLYFGDGKSWDLLLKGVIRTRDYLQLDGWTDQLYTSLAAHGRYFRPMTLLIADSHSREGDIVDTSGLELGNKGRRLKQLVGRDYQEYFRQLTNGELRVMLDLFEKYRRVFANTAFERYFIGMFEARLAQEVKLAQEKLSFLPDIEAWFVTLLEHEILPDAFGPKAWFPRMAARAEAAGLARASDEESSLGLSLGQYRVLLGQLIGEGEVPVDRLDGIMGEGWQPRLAAMVAFRNQTLHGKLRMALGEKWAGWAGVMSQACEAGRLYVALAANFGEE